jgi:hypothetical protein
MAEQINERFLKNLPIPSDKKDKLYTDSQLKGFYVKHIAAFITSYTRINMLMKMKEISEENVKTMLAKYSIDYSLIENEVNSYSVRQIIAKNFDLAKELGIKGTPSYIINGNFVFYPVSYTYIYFPVLQIIY